MKKLIYEIVSHGVEHSQYFDGCGVAYSDFEHSDTGVGDTEKAAAEDALEQMFSSGDLSDGDNDVEVKELEAEIAALDEKRDAHRDCYSEILSEYQRGKLYRPSSKGGGTWPVRKWCVSRQRPWNGEPALEFIEIAPGGLDHASPGMMVKPSAEVLTDPTDVAALAVSLAREYNCSVYFSTAEVGAGEGDEQDEMALSLWAGKLTEKIKEESDEAVERAHEECELHWFVSIRWALVEE